MLTVALVMAETMVATAAPAFSPPEIQTPNKGAVVCILKFDGLEVVCVSE